MKSDCEMLEKDVTFKMESTLGKNTFSAVPERHHPIARPTDEQLPSIMGKKKQTSRTSSSITTFNQNEIALIKTNCTIYV